MELKYRLPSNLLLHYIVKKIMKIGPLVTKFYHLALGGPVVMTHRVERWGYRAEKEV